MITYLVISLLNVWSPYTDIQILQVEQGVRAADNLLVGHDDVLDVLIDEIIKTVNMLLHQALY